MDRSTNRPSLRQPLRWQGATMRWWRGLRRWTSAAGWWRPRLRAAVRGWAWQCAKRAVPVVGSAPARGNRRGAERAFRLRGWQRSAATKWRWAMQRATMPPWQALPAIRPSAVALRGRAGARGGAQRSGFRDRPDLEPAAQLRSGWAAAGENHWGFARAQRPAPGSTPAAAGLLQTRISRGQSTSRHSSPGNRPALAARAAE